MPRVTKTAPDVVLPRDLPMPRYEYQQASEGGRVFARPAPADASSFAEESRHRTDAGAPPAGLALPGGRPPD